jgi:hypothetical protein
MKEMTGFDQHANDSGVIEEFLPDYDLHPNDTGMEDRPNQGAAQQDDLEVEGFLNGVGDEDGRSERDRPLRPLTGAGLEPIEGNELEGDEEMQEEGSIEEKEEGEDANEEAEKRAGREENDIEEDAVVPGGGEEKGGNQDEPSSAPGGMGLQQAKGDRPTDLEQNQEGGGGEEMQIDQGDNKDVPGSSFGGIGLENAEGNRSSDLTRRGEGGGEEEMLTENDRDDQDVSESPLSETGSRGAANDDPPDMNLDSEEDKGNQSSMDCPDRTKCPDCHNNTRNNRKGKNSKKKNQHKSSKKNKQSKTSEKAHPPIPKLCSECQESDYVAVIARVRNYPFSF